MNTVIAPDFRGWQAPEIGCNVEGTRVRQLQIAPSTSIDGIYGLVIGE